MVCRSLMVSRAEAYETGGRFRDRMVASLPPGAIAPYTELFYIMTWWNGLLRQPAYAFTASRVRDGMLAYQVYEVWSATEGDGWSCHPIALTAVPVVVAICISQMLATYPRRFEHAVAA